MNGSTLTSSPLCGPTAGDEAVISEGVRVVVRVRPLSTKERANAGVHNCVRCLPDCIIIDGGAHARASMHPKALIPASQPTRATTRPYQFSVDQVFHTHASQIEVYEQSCKRIVEGVFHGINGSILAYGATGSGKTHTMFGSTMSAAGIVYQAVQDIFSEKERLEEEEGKRVRIKCSFLEVYNEDVFDLLAKPAGEGSSGVKSFANGTGGTPGREGKRVPLQVRESFGTTGSASPWLDMNENSSVHDGGLHIRGLTHIFPETLDDFVRGIEHGHAQRFVASTGANSQSSRSHAIITVQVEVRHGNTREDADNPRSSLSTTDDADGAETSIERSPSKKPPRKKKKSSASTVTIAKIQFADLAGSERAASTSNTGLRLREGGNINRSLLALGAVVQSLVQQKVRRRQTGGKGGGKIFIPYRGSKLTRLLRDSIGGNCRTQMIFCLSPSTKHTEETVNTMKFAMNAKEIQVEAHRNEFSVNSSRLAKTQEVLIEELREELARAQAALAVCGGGVAGAGLNNISSSEENRSQEADAILGAGNLSPSSESTSQAKPRQALSTSRWYSPFSHRSNLDSDRRSSAQAPASLPMPLRISRGAQRDTLTPSAVAFSGAVPSASEDLSCSSTSPGIPDVLQDSTLPRLCPSRTARPSVFAESAPLFSELEAKLKNFSAQKESLYHEVRDAQEREREGEMQLRKELWRLATFLVSDASGSRARGEVDGNGTTAVGVAGLRKIIASKEAEQAQQATELVALTERLDDVDRQFAATRQDLLRERQGTSLELLLDNARLRQGCTEAECLAAHYHQEYRSLLNRQAEYAEALSKCVEAIQRLRPYLVQLSAQISPTHSSSSSSAIAAAVEAANVALLFALLPTASTTQMETVFEAALRSTVTSSPLKTTPLPVSLPSASLPPAAPFLHPPLAPSPTKRSVGSKSRSPLRGGGSAGNSASSHLAQHFRDLMATAESMHLTSTTDREASETTDTTRPRRGQLCGTTAEGNPSLERRPGSKRADKINDSAHRVPVAVAGSVPKPFGRTLSLSGLTRSTSTASAAGQKRPTGSTADKTALNKLASRHMPRSTNEASALAAKKNTGGSAQGVHRLQRSVSAPLSFSRSMSYTSGTGGAPIRKPRASAEAVPATTSLTRRRIGAQKGALYGTVRRTSAVKPVGAPPSTISASSSPSVRSNTASLLRTLASDASASGDNIKRLHQHGNVNLQLPASTRESTEATTNSSGSPRKQSGSAAVRKRQKGSKKPNKIALVIPPAYPNVENVQPRVPPQQSEKRSSTSSTSSSKIGKSGVSQTTTTARGHSPSAKTREIPLQCYVGDADVSVVSPSVMTSLSRISSSSSDNSSPSTSYKSETSPNYYYGLDKHSPIDKASLHKSKCTSNGVPFSSDSTPELTVERLKECAAVSAPALPQYNATGSPLIYSGDGANKETTLQPPQSRTRTSFTDDLMVSRSTCFSDALSPVSRGQVSNQC